MSEHQTLAILMICMVIMSLGIAGVDRWNDRLREENKRLRDRLAEMERNDPLTLDELRKMIGEPVWISFPEEGRWGMISWYNSEFFKDYCNGFLFVDQYGIDWIAYRHKPKEEK